MKTLFISSALVSLLTVSSYTLAADAALAEQRAEQLKNEFSLTDGQATRLQGMLTRATLTDAEKQAKHAKKMQQKMTKRLGRMQKKLSLSDSQVAQMKALMQEKMQQRRAMRNTMQTRLAAILTPAQLEQMQSMRKQRWGKMKMKQQRGHHNRHRDGGRHHGKAQAAE